MTQTSLRSALAAIPDMFRDQLLKEYEESQQAALRGDWEKVGLKAGKICEISYVILEGVCTGTYPAAISKPGNMQDACRQLEQKAQSGISRSARIQIPRLIAALYELRNNRAIGHAGGEVSPNQMDGALFNQSIKWILAELVRLFHKVDIGAATKIVEQLSLRWSPAIWESENRKRVIVEGLGRKEQLLTLLYFSDLQATESQLQDWLEITRAAHLRERYVAPLHEMNFVDHDAKNKIVRLLPPGIREVEEKILRKI